MRLLKDGNVREADMCISKDWALLASCTLCAVLPAAVWHSPAHPRPGESEILHVSIQDRKKAGAYRTWQVSPLFHGRCYGVDFDTRRLLRFDAAGITAMDKQFAPGPTLVTATSKELLAVDWSGTLWRSSDKDAKVWRSTKLPFDEISILQASESALLVCGVGRPRECLLLRHSDDAVVSFKSMRPAALVRDRAYLVSEDDSTVSWVSIKSGRPQKTGIVGIPVGRFGRFLMIWDAEKSRLTLYNEATLKETVAVPLYSGGAMASYWAIGGDRLWTWDGKTKTLYAITLNGEKTSVQVDVKGDARLIGIPQGVLLTDKFGPPDQVKSSVKIVTPRGAELLVRHVTTVDDWVRPSSSAYVDGVVYLYGVKHGYIKVKLPSDEH
ncbi:MAG: hypothetical protein IH851_01740 [Armatimonadetes bacterium]|nr:hypothetical protein [Armatimonadota bacterium]